MVVVALALQPLALVYAYVIVCVPAPAVDGLNTYDFNNESNLAKGIYYLVVISNQEKIIQKVIKN